MTVKTTDEKLYDLWLILSAIGRENIFPDLDKKIEECRGDEKKIAEVKKEFDEFKNTIVPDKWKALSMWRWLRTKIKGVVEPLFDKINEMDEKRQTILREYQQTKAEIEELKKAKNKDIKAIAEQEGEIEKLFNEEAEKLAEKTGIKVVGTIGQQTIICAYTKPEDAMEIEIEFQDEYPYNEIGFLRDLFDRCAWKMTFLPSELVADAAEILED